MDVVAFRREKIVPVPSYRATGISDKTQSHAHSLPFCDPLDFITDPGDFLYFLSTINESSL